MSIVSSPPWASSSQERPQVPVVALAHGVLERGLVGHVEDLPADGLEVEPGHAGPEVEEAGDRLARQLCDLLDAVDREDEDVCVSARQRAVARLLEVERSSRQIQLRIEPGEDLRAPLVPTRSARARGTGTRGPPQRWRFSRFIPPPLPSSTTMLVSGLHASSRRRWIRSRRAPVMAARGSVTREPSAIPACGSRLAHAPRLDPANGPGEVVLPRLDDARRRSPGPIPTCPRTGRSFCVCRRRARGLAIYPRVRRSSASSPTRVSRAIRRRDSSSSVGLDSVPARQRACRPSSASRIATGSSGLRHDPGAGLADQLRGRTVRRHGGQDRALRSEVFEHLPREDAPAAARRPRGSAGAEPRSRAAARASGGAGTYGMSSSRSPRPSPRPTRGRPAGSRRRSARRTSSPDSASAVRNGRGSRLPKKLPVCVIRKRGEGGSSSPAKSSKSRRSRSSPRGLSARSRAPPRRSRRRRRRSRRRSARRAPRRRARPAP